MGNRGPSKKPTELKILQGVPGGLSKLLPNEPKPKKVEQAAPPYKLLPEERKVWRQIAPKLERLGLLTEIDLRALARYCEVYVRYLKAKRTIDEKGFYYPMFHDQSDEQRAAGQKPKLKYLATFPEVSIVSQMLKELRLLEREFGMTPAARANISVTPASSSTSNSYRSEVKRRLYGA